MTTTTQTRSDVFKLAWDFYRTDPQDGFGEALRRAWAWTKKMAATAGRFMKSTKGAKAVRLTSYNKGQNALTDRTARQIARMGR